MNGLIHIYTGNGKGKTTAAIGLCIRAAGNNKRVLFSQMLKSGRTGEMEILNDMEQIRVIRPEARVKGFVWELDESEKAIMCECTEEALVFIEREISLGKWDMVIMDEILGCIHNGFISVDRILNILKNKPDHVEIVLTGRNAPEALMEAADYVSEIMAVKHPYQKGIGARKGIEF